MFLNYSALNLTGGVNAPLGITGSNIDTSEWGNVWLQTSASAVALTSSLQVTDIEIRYGVPDPSTWQTLTTIAVPANSVVSSSILPINTKWGRILTNVTNGTDGAVKTNASFSNRSTLIFSSSSGGGVTPAEVTGAINTALTPYATLAGVSGSFTTPAQVSGAISVAQLTASQIATGQLSYDRNSPALIDQYSVTISSNTASINPLNGAAQSVSPSSNTQISASFGSLTAGKTATTSVLVSAGGGLTLTFGGVDFWIGSNPASVSTGGGGTWLLVLTNTAAGVIGSWQTLAV